MSFAEPIWLLVLGPLGLLAVLGHAAAQGTLRRLGEFGYPRPAAAWRAVPWRPWIGAAGLGLLVVALARPRVEVGGPAREEVDLLVVLDVSRSMSATDLPPSRLAVARQDLRLLAASLPAVRLGLVTVAGEARVDCPLTDDREAFMRFVEAADPEQVPRGGTALARGLEVALERAPASGHRAVAVLLLSDGEELVDEDALRRAAEAAAERGVPVFAILYGSAQGAPVPERDPANADGGASPPVTRADRARLQEVARRAGGSLIEGPTSPRRVARVESALCDLAPGGRQTGRPGRGSPARTCHHWFLGGAAVLLALEWWMRGRS